MHKIHLWQSVARVAYLLLLVLERAAAGKRSLLPAFPCNRLLFLTKLDSTIEDVPGKSVERISYVWLTLKST